MITTAELTAMRATQALTMDATVAIQRRTLASDGAGGHTQTWATVATTIGRLAPGAGQDSVLAGQERSVHICSLRAIGEDL
jgi:head-tail adaptor